MHIANAFTAAEVDARRRRLMRICHLSRWDRRFLAVQWLARLVAEHRRCCRVLEAWFDKDDAADLETREVAVVIGLAGIRRHMRLIDYLTVRYKVTTTEIAAATI